MGKKKATGTGIETTTIKKNRKAINLDALRILIKEGNDAREIMKDMGIAQVGSLRNAVFMLSQKDERFYAVPGLVDETRFRPLMKVGKAGIRIPIEKLPFAYGETVSYEIQSSVNDGIAVVMITGKQKLMVPEEGEGDPTGEDSTE